MRTYTYGLIEYKTPIVTPLYFAPIGVAEVATRTCYSSYSGSDNEVVRELGEGIISPTLTDDLHDACASHLVEKIVHAHQHESVIESVTCSFLIKNINRSVLAELSRHRIGVSLSVQSTRYTVSNLIKLFFWSEYFNNPRDRSSRFIDEAYKLDLFNINDLVLVRSKLLSIYKQMLVLSLRGREEMIRATLSKEAVGVVNNKNNYSTSEAMLKDIIKAKNKRNAGDTIKAVLVDEMFSVGLVLTMNLRSLKHFLKLRNSGAAWKPIQVLAQELEKAVPEDYKNYLFKR